MAVAADRDKDSRDELAAHSPLSSLTRAAAFGCANDLAAHTRSNWDRSPDSNTPNTDCSADRTNRSSIEAAAAQGTFEGLRNGGEMENFGH